MTIDTHTQEAVFYENPGILRSIDSRINANPKEYLSFWRGTFGRGAARFISAALYVPFCDRMNNIFELAFGRQGFQTYPRASQWLIFPPKQVRSAHVTLSSDFAYGYLQHFGVFRLEPFSTNIPVVFSVATYLKVVTQYRFPSIFRMCHAQKTRVWTLDWGNQLT